MSDPIAKHRREVILFIWLPIIGTTLLLLVVVGALGVMVATGNLSQTQLTTTASILLVIFVLLPIALVMVIFDVALILLAYGTDKIPRLVVKIVRPLRRLSQKIAEYGRQSTLLAEPLIFIEKNLTRLSVILEGLVAWLKNETTQPEESPSE